MPTRKVSDIPNKERCLDQEHNPPRHMVFEPGNYEHECPSCKKKTMFRVEGSYM